MPPPPPVPDWIDPPALRRWSPLFAAENLKGNPPRRPRQLSGPARLVQGDSRQGASRLRDDPEQAPPAGQRLRGVVRVEGWGLHACGFRTLL